MSCAACFGSEEIFFEAEEGSVLVECVPCGLVSRGPKPDPTTLRAYYEKSWQFSEPRPERCFSSAAEFIYATVGFVRIESAMDVGAKDSALLDAVDRAGVHLQSKETIDARASGDVKQAWLGSGYVSPKKYQLVVATHILEHAIDLGAFMQDLGGCVSSGGYLYIEVPSLELGTKDISACDDINPNHLWHFTLGSLTRLLERFGFVVLSSRADDKAVGWPCNRIIGQKRPPTTARDVWKAQKEEYRKAALKIYEERADRDGLYGASWSCGLLLREGIQMPVFDLYRDGEIHGVRIQKPAAMGFLGIRRVWLTPRFWNSQVEIKKWINENYPGIEVLCPYE